MLKHLACCSLFKCLIASCRCRVSLTTSTPQSPWTCYASLLCDLIGTACPSHPPATEALQLVSHDNITRVCFVFCVTHQRALSWSLCTSRPGTARFSSLSGDDGCDEEPGLHGLEPRDPDQQLPSSTRLRRPHTLPRKVLPSAAPFALLLLCISVHANRPIFIVRSSKVSQGLMTEAVNCASQVSLCYQSVDLLYLL